MYALNALQIIYFLMLIHYRIVAYIMYLVYFASEVVSMEIEQAHFDEFFEVCTCATYVGGNFQRKIFDDFLSWKLFCE